MAIRQTRKFQLNVEPYLTGFSLIELIVVLAGLGMLSSLVLPNFIDLLDSNNVDEAKTLLNTAAADCLQELRKARTTGNTPTIDTRIVDPISNPNAKLERIGYKADPTNEIINNKYSCEEFTLTPIAGELIDTVRFNMGFQLDLSEGKLTKIANTSDLTRKGDNCNQWASNGCTSSAAAKELKEYKDQIKAEKAKCDTAFSSWESNGMAPIQFKRWDSSKGPSTCPSTPPKPGSPTYKGTESCNITGCTPGIPVWGLWNKKEKTGTTFSTYDAYVRARDIQLGEDCAAQVKEYVNNKATNLSSAGVPLSECNNDLYWFYEGNNAGSQKAWEILYHKANNPSGKQTLSDGSELYVCLGDEYKTEALMTKCINDDEKAGCENKITNRIASKENGFFKAQSSGPIPCTNEHWFCDGSDKGSEEKYKESDCGSVKPIEEASKPGYCSRDWAKDYPQCQ